VTGVKKACELTGKSRATIYRRRNGVRSGCREQPPVPANALSARDREELLAVLDSPRFADKAPRQVWARLTDEGTYLASVRRKELAISRHWSQVPGHRAGQQAGCVGFG
jgi:putative transposase